MSFTRLKRNLYALCGYLILTLLLTWPLAPNLNKAIPGDGFDGWQNFWNLWWVKVALVERGTTPYFTDYLYYPTGASLIFHTLNIFNGLFALPFSLGFKPQAGGLLLAYNAVVLFSFVMAGYGAFLLACYVLGERHKSPAGWFAAFAAGLVYAFSPFHFAHLLGHMQVFSLEWVPFHVLCFLRGSGAGRGVPLPKRVWKPALFLVLAALCDWYNAFYLAIFTALYLFYVAFSARWNRLKGALSVAVGTWVLFGLLLSPFLWPMVREASASDYMLPEPEHVFLLSADLLAFITPNEMHPLWGRWVQSWWSGRSPAPLSERMIFAGYLPLMLSAFALWKRRKEALLWALSAIAFGVLALGPALRVGGCQTDFPLPYALLHEFVPFVRIARSVSRFDLMVMLSLAALVGLGLEAVLMKPEHKCSGYEVEGPTGLKYDLSQPGRGSRLFIGGLVAVALICFEFLSAPYPLSPPDTPEFYLQIAQEEGDFAILNVPMDWDRPGYLLYQTVHGKRLISGYLSRENPLSIVERTPVFSHFRFAGPTAENPDIIAQDVSQIGLSVLEHFKVRYVVIDLYQLPDEWLREKNLKLARQIFGPVEPCHQDARLIVYCVPKPRALQPFLILGEGWGPRQMETGFPIREMAQEATLKIYSSWPCRARLLFTAWGVGGEAELEIRVGEEQVSAHLIGKSHQEIATPYILFRAGENVLRLIRRGGDAQKVIFSKVDLTLYTGYTRISLTDSTDFSHG
ncbi:MAG: hypothetical protein ACUVV0_04365 [Anaerolineae bacterium]